MKKILAILALSMATVGTAIAANYVSIDVENVRGRSGQADNTAQYIRAGKGFGDYQVDLQNRRTDVSNRLEFYGSKNSTKFLGITPFVGIGHSSTGASYNYGLVGANYTLPIGPGSLALGVKTRLGSTEVGARTKQTVSHASYSIPVAKQVALNFNVSRTSGTIRENAAGLGLRVSF